MKINNIFIDENQKLDVSKIIMGIMILLQIFSLTLDPRHAFIDYDWYLMFPIVVFSILYMLFIEKRNKIMVIPSLLLLVGSIMHCLHLLIGSIMHFVHSLDTTFGYLYGGGFGLLDGLLDFIIFGGLLDIVHILFYTFISILFAKNIKNHMVIFVNLIILIPFEVIAFLFSLSHDYDGSIMTIARLLFYIALIMFFGKKLNNESYKEDLINEHINIAKLIILSIVTFGIYTILWAFKKMCLIRFMSGNKSGNCTGELLCYIFVPFYFLYWIYTRTQDIYKYATKKGINITDNSVINLIISFFGFGIIAIALLQRDLNTIPVKIDNEDSFQEKEKNQIGQNSNIVNKLRDLAQLKEEGILTEDEFLNKKNELLDKI